MGEVYVWELPPSCSECFACRHDAYDNDECGISGELLEDPPFCVDNFTWHDKWDKRRPDCPLKLKERSEYGGERGMMVDTLRGMSEYLWAIELLIKDAFPSSKVCVFCEQSPFSSSANKYEVKAYVDGYGACVTIDIFEGTTEERVSEKLISLIKGEMERSK